MGYFDEAFDVNSFDSPTVLTINVSSNFLTSLGPEIVDRETRLDQKMISSFDSQLDGPYVSRPKSGVLVISPPHTFRVFKPLVMIIIALWSRWY